MKKMRKLLSITLIAVMIMSMAACGNSQKGKEKTDKNETGINVEGSIVSWGNMEVDNEDLNLTEEQIEVLKYFDNDYFPINNYESFQRYPEAYRNAQISFNGIVKDVLETDDEKYTVSVYMVETHGYVGGYQDEGLTIDDLLESGTITEDKIIIVSGKHPEEGRVIKGDPLCFYGRYIDTQEFRIGEATEYYPYVTVNYTTDQPFEGETQRFGFEEVEKVAKAVFGDNIKIKEPVLGEDYEVDELHSFAYFFYLVTLDNQSNANFTSFEFPKTGGYIFDSKSTMDELRYFNVAADFSHYLVTIFNRNLNLTYMEYYDRDLNKIWSREFKGTENVSFDYTKDNIFFTANNDFYIIDTETGEDKVEPVMVGEKVKVSAVKDGIILIGTGNKDNIMKVGLDGSVIWKTSADIEVTGCNGIQIVDGNVVAYIYSIGENGMYSVDKLVVVDADGKITTEFTLDEFNGI